MEGHHQRWKAGKRGVDDGGVNCRSEGIVTKGGVAAPTVRGSGIRVDQVAVLVGEMSGSEVLEAKERSEEARVEVNNLAFDDGGGEGAPARSEWFE